MIKTQMNEPATHARACPRGLLWAAMILAGAVALASCSQPSASDVTWEPASTEVGVGDGVRVAVRLEDRSGLVTLDANAVESIRIDMEPDGMATMVAPVRAVPTMENESLAWEADLAMGGRWAVKVTAQVPGQPLPVRGEVIVTAVEE